MKALLPFDKIIVGGTEIGGSSLVPGSASVSVGGDDKTFVAADGSLLRIRSARTFTASFKALGDLCSLSTPRGFAVNASFLLNGVELLAFAALASASFDSETRSSSISLKGIPESD